MSEIKRRACRCAIVADYISRGGERIQERECHRPAERCDMCGQKLAHDYVHWNGAFYQCESCTVLERLDPDQNGLDPLFGGTFSQEMEPIYPGESA
jgi:hypothetical protein